MFIYKIFKSYTLMINYKNILKKIKIFFKKYYALNAIDKKMLKYIDYNNGYYIECGANDGLRQSNTFFYEKSKKWKGVLIEPSYKFKQLTTNRSKKNFFFKNCCVSFKNHNNLIRMYYSNLMTTINDKKINNKRIDFGYKKIAKNFLSSDEKEHYFFVKGRTLNSILNEINAPSIVDFFSLDTEGTEYEVLNGIDFSKYNFKYLLIETRFFIKVKNFLEKRNYNYLEKLSFHDYLFSYNYK